MRALTLPALLAAIVVLASACVDVTPYPAIDSGPACTAPADDAGCAEGDGATTDDGASADGGVE